MSEAEADHALLSPSGAAKWLRCSGALAAEYGQPDTTSPAALEGSVAHKLAENVLKSRIDPTLTVAGKTITFTGGQNASCYVGTYQRIHASDPGPGFQVSEDMAEHVDTYVNRVWEKVVEAGGELLVEYRVDFSSVVGTPNSFGTADALGIFPTELQVHDLKFGRGVKVDAENNEQLMIYALGALAEFELLQDFETVRLCIHQPRLGHYSEWVISVADLQKFAEYVLKRAIDAVIAYNIAICDGLDSLPADTFTPGEKQCRWCKAAAICTARAQHVMNTVADDFVDLTRPLEPQLSGAKERIARCDAPMLAAVYDELNMIEDWCKAVRGRVLSELSNGNTVPRYKLVQGNRGNRAWASADSAEDMLKSFRLKKEQMYSMKVISPTAAEKLLKKSNPRQWSKLENLITRPDGSPTVVPETDPRPALTPANDFENMDAADATAADLL